MHTFQFLELLAITVIGTLLILVLRVRWNIWFWITLFSCVCLQIAQTLPALMQGMKRETNTQNQTFIIDSLLAWLSPEIRTDYEIWYKLAGESYPKIITLQSDLLWFFTIAGGPVFATMLILVFVIQLNSFLNNGSLSSSEADEVCDSPYFLGFCLTLSSLVFQFLNVGLLEQFNRGDVITQAAVALSTTFVGVLSRFKLRAALVAKETLELSKLNASDSVPDVTVLLQSAIHVENLQAALLKLLSSIGEVDQKLADSKENMAISEAQAVSITEQIARIESSQKSIATSTATASHLLKEYSDEILKGQRQFEQDTRQTAREAKRTLSILTRALSAMATLHTARKKFLSRCWPWSKAKDGCE